jgi:hypothetical protein
LWHIFQKKTRHQTLYGILRENTGNGSTFLEPYSPLVNAIAELLTFNQTQTHKNPEKIFLWQLNRSNLGEERERWKSGNAGM